MYLQDGLELEVAVKICKVTDDENKRKSEARVEKFLEEACKFCSVCSYHSYLAFWLDWYHTGYLAKW